jgi:hypothetical protein
MPTFALLCVASLVSADAATPTAPADPPVLAVMPTRATTLDAKVATVLETLMVSVISETGRYRVISAADIGALLGRERLKDVAGCDQVPESVRDAVASSGLSYDRWTLLQQFGAAGMDRATFDKFVASGLSYDLWAPQFADASENLGLEVSKWVFSALLVIDIAVVLGMLATTNGINGSSSGVIFTTEVATAPFGAVALILWAVDLLGNLDDPPHSLPPFSPPSKG